VSSQDSETTESDRYEYRSAGSGAHNAGAAATLFVHARRRDEPLKGSRREHYEPQTPFSSFTEVGMSNLEHPYFGAFA
jgi:hypothetical protein